MSLFNQVGPFNGAPFPPYVAGRYYQPHYLVTNNNTLAISANRLYRCGFYVAQTQAFAGGFFFNSGVGDNGKKVRIGVWDKSGNLKKDFGETVLTGASAVRSVANSITLPGPDWYQIGLVSDTGPTLYTMDANAYATGVGVVPNANISVAFGIIGAPASFSGVGQANAPVGDYAAFSYAALPDPITAATVTVMTALTAGGTGTFPYMGLYA